MGIDARHELERIDRELASAETRLQALHDASDTYHHKGFMALHLEDQADEAEHQTLLNKALDLREQARTLRAECLHWAKCREDEQQLIAGLRMERKGVELSLKEQAI